MKRNPTPENRSVRTRVARAESRSHPQIEVKPESFGLTKFLGANAIRKTKREIWRTASALKGQNPNGLAHVSSSSNTLLPNETGANGANLLPALSVRSRKDKATALPPEILPTKFPIPEMSSSESLRRR